MSENLTENFLSVLLLLRPKVRFNGISGGASQNKKKIPSFLPECMASLVRIINEQYSLCPSLSDAPMTPLTFVALDYFHQRSGSDWTLFPARF